MLQALRDPPLSEQLAKAVLLASEGRADELTALIAAVRGEYGAALRADDELLLATLLGAAYGNSGHREQALTALAAAQPLLPAASRVRQARYYSVAAVMPDNQREPEQAIDAGLRALALVEDAPPDEDVRVTLGNCAMLFARLSLFPLAVQTVERSIEVSARLGRSPGPPAMQAGYTYLTWGLRLEHLGLGEDSRARWTTAHDHFAAALGNAQLSTLFQGWAATGRAIAAARLGRLDDSRHDLAYASTLPVRPANPELDRMLAHATATLRHAEGRYAEARTALLHTWELTVDRDLPLWLQDVAWLLGRVAVADGDFAEALRWHREMHERYGRAQYKAWLSRATAARLRVEQEALRRRTQELESDVLSDPLTGVSNRRAFDLNLPRLVARAHATAAPFTLAIIDIDHFKRINDTYGHPVGDEVLRRIARILREQCREPDRCARYGGDELALCLPIPAVQTTAVLARMAARIAEHPWSTLAPSLTVTVSTGLAQLVPGDSAMTLFGAADQSLLRAKRSRIDPVTDGGGPDGGVPMARAATSG
jgi:diguanylate cyclase (GGDEF)-like protein